MPREWQPIVADMPRVQRLVHLSMRYTDDDVERIRTELLRVRKRTYEEELTLQAARVGCSGRRGSLGNSVALTELNNASKEDAASIVNTYNYDLAAAIANIAAENPKANRNTYYKRLGEWEGKRAEWKNPQITQYAGSTARSQAQRDFYRFNDAMGVARLEPRTAACPVCNGWIARGEVPIKVATNNPPPYHTNCPHGWATTPGRVAPSECPLLWMGA
jgi:hypothetical protein